jgi:hypothetical protein
MTTTGVGYVHAGGLSLRAVQSPQGDFVCLLLRIHSLVRGGGRVPASCETGRPPTGKTAHRCIHYRTNALPHSRTYQSESRAPRLPNHVPSLGSKSLVLGKSAMASEPCIQPTSAISDATSTVNDASRNADQRSLSTAMSR